MSKQPTKVMIALCITCFIFSVISVVVAVDFFTKDNKDKYTTAQVDEIIVSEKEETFQNEEISQNEENSEKEPEIIKEDKEKQISFQENKSESIPKEETKTEVSSRQKKLRQEEVIVPNKTEKPKQEDTLLKTYKGYSTIGKIEIPKTGLDISVLSQVTTNGMKVAPCLLMCTGSFNQSGTNLIVGHNYRNGKLFSNNKNLQIGDKIYITSLDGTRKEYTVYDKFTTTPEDVSYISKNKNNSLEIALSTCSDDGNSRIIILAK